MGTGEKKRKRINWGYDIELRPPIHQRTLKTVHCLKTRLKDEISILSHLRLCKTGVKRVAPNYNYYYSTCESESSLRGFES